MIGMRAEAYEYGAPEYVAMEIYLMWRARGMTIETPATINPDRRFGHGTTALFEPAHGSSPHRTASRRSNPTGAWLALADLLAWCPDLAVLSLHATLRAALDRVIDDGAPTYDLAAPGVPVLDLDQFNERVLNELASVSA